MSLLRIQQDISAPDVIFRQTKNLKPRLRYFYWLLTQQKEMTYFLVIVTWGMGYVYQSNSFNYRAAGPAGANCLGSNYKV